MPLNTLRLNHPPSSHPNPRITFIEPLPLPSTLASATSPTEADHSTAETFLHAIAAQCLPIMKKHHLSITTLEEHEPNREFIGRNFNNGEIVQLVLRSKSGSWLPFNMVQMVMMHELAHNTHMNHGKQFWEVRNGYVKELRELWAQGYTGEGFWGSGQRMSDMQAVMGNNIVDNEVLKDLPVCGGTFRSRRRRKRRANKQELNWREKRDKRIEKKFGKNGVSLGEDEDRRMLLEIGKKGPVGGKPRVAGSNRGRELRAAAALARFEVDKKEGGAVRDEGEETNVKEEEEEGEEGSDYEVYEDVDSSLQDAHNTNGQRLLDGQGNAMVRVCGDEDNATATDDLHIKQEVEELSGLERYFPRKPTQAKAESNHTGKQLSGNAQRKLKKEPPATSTAPPSITTIMSTNNPTSDSDPPIAKPREVTTCSICTLSNPTSSAVTCNACAHVLQPGLDRRHWPCPLSSCRELGYINAGNVGLCGLCGTKKPSL